MSTELILIRYIKNDNDTFGAISIYDQGNIISTLQTCENSRKLIPEGNYKIINTFSPKFKRDLWLVKDVPNRSGIRIHAGNNFNDSNGCILVSLARTENYLLNSAYAINLLEQLLDKTKEYNLLIS